MKSKWKTQNKRRESQIDVAPLMDMVFILLIFFVVTSTFNRETGIDVSKPKAATAQELSKESILVGLSRQGSIHVNDAQVTLPALRRVLENIMRDTPERPVIIVADRDAPGGMIVDIIDECNQAGIKKVSIEASVE